MTFHVPEEQRIRIRGWPSGDKTCGIFVLPPHHTLPLKVIASSDLGWEHVSVSTESRCPTWEEMCYAKSLFWDAEDTVMQLHPPQSDWVNNHPYCLHLWRPVDVDLPLPPSFMVGFKEIGVLR